jgi:hypothetical protein
MQAPGRAAIRAARTAIKMLIVQDEGLEVVGIMGERMQGSRRTTALADDRFANLGRKAFDVLGIVAILAASKAAAAFREDWLQVNNKAINTQRHRVMVMVCLRS